MPKPTTATTEVSSLSERYHPDAPTDSEGFPVHPDDHTTHICGRKKSEKTTPTPHGRERDDVSYCLQDAGWGADGDSEPGDACKFHNGRADTDQRGPKNPNWKLGLYSDFLTEDDKERAQDWIELSGGDRLSVEDFVRMGEKAMLFEFTRIERAMLQAPDPSLSNKFCCRFCGWEIPSRDVMVCPNCDQHLHVDDGDAENVVPTAEWVDMHDRQISERIERWVDMLKKYKEVVDGTDLNVNLGVEFEDAIRRAEEIAESDSDGKVEYLYGEQ